MALNEVNNNVAKLTEDLQTIDISDDVGVQTKEQWSLSSISSSHDVMYDPQLLKSVQVLLKLRRNTQILFAGPCNLMTIVVVSFHCFNNLPQLDLWKSLISNTGSIY